MTKEEWLNACAAQYVKRADVNQIDAAIFAEACAGTQEGPVDSWQEPEDAANDDMDCWDADGEEGAP